MHPSLEYDKQPRPTAWQPYTDAEFQAVATKKYWKLGKLGRGPESDAEKEKRLRVMQAKEFSEHIRRHNMYQISAELQRYLGPDTKVLEITIQLSTASCYARMTWEGRSPGRQGHQISSRQVNVWC
ncbi:hypothetical protein WJX84_005857 [Apatococcus fuscideae]|uniref:Uncharacterized protein n=1 Tax=Apatococcus fuscideae TaxID=2026836 RepID=A0AAW1SR40_9CHLO